MVTHLKILNPRDIQSFEVPPKFTSEERKRYFYLMQWAQDFINSLRTTHNKIGFIMQYGYFQSTGRFFSAKKFHRKDIEFIVGRIKVSPDEFNPDTYSAETFNRHQKVILERLGYRRFDKETRNLLLQEAISLCANQIKPRFLFLSLVDFLKEKKIELPGYYSLSKIITQALKSFEKELLTFVEEQISPEQKLLLDELIESKNLTPPEGQQKLPLNYYDTRPYKLTLLKKFHQSIRPAKVRENLKDFNCLQTLFRKLNPVITNLQLRPETIQYYTQIVLRAQVFQISRRDEKKYLYLLSFVIHQYYRLNDLLTETILQAVKKSFNKSVNEHKEKFYETRKNRHHEISDLVNAVQQQLTILRKIKETVSTPVPDSEKLKTVEILLRQTDTQDYNTLKERLTLLEKESRRIVKDEDYYAIVESESLKLQNRVSEIIKQLEFSPFTSDKSLMEAIEYYKNRNGNLTANVPLDFIDDNEQTMIFNSNGKLRISLYKALFFEKVAAGIKSGSLNLLNSYKYRAFDDYLIQKEIWKDKKDDLLERAELTAFADFQHVEPKLRKTLRKQYAVTNENINNAENKFAKITTAGKLRVVTPKTEKETTKTGSDLFPKDRYIPLVEILSTINKFSRFSDCFEHWKIKHNRAKPNPLIFFAGIMGYGCNIGIRKIAKISRNIPQNKLENTVNWYFSTENINRANDRIIEFLDYLDLPDIFRPESHRTHTSSDGQKFSIAVESLNADYSFKYYGKDKGVSVYSFIDQSHRLFYSTVISPAEREAAYVIDGLMHNDVVQSEVHSTDTHGYSEIVFGVTHLLGISFAPRIKNFKKQYLYNFKGKKALRDLNYKILPNRRINTKIIHEHWDDILRFAATIKLKQTTASQLFKRLNSYSRQHPLYFALKEFGRIVKSIFLLKYINDVALRQIIELQLNKMENSQKFSKAIFYDNNQEFQQSTKEAQLIADGCKRLIENAIICWNYLYLSQIINNAESDTQKQNLLQTIKNGSVVAWQHINIHGEYDFSDDALRESIEFNLPKLEQLKGKDFGKRK